ncbi:ABC transporter substrate-binding protein [Geitlerinema splendidum]|jgi:putative ABC transport system substrate-binding protein|nr:ABC transporter substrate-binding protein [Geitlerinema splendidum]
MSKATTLKQTLKTLLLSLLLMAPLGAASPPKKIAVTQFVDHVAADEVRRGVIEELAKKGFKEGENLTVTFENAQGNVGTAGQIARKFIGLSPDVIVAITTPSAQAIVKAAEQQGAIPIVFSAVTDPVEAGLVSSLIHPEGNVTGVMDAPPIKEQIAFLKKILPEAKTVGVLYNPGDNGSVSSLEVIRAEAKAQGLTLVEATPFKSSDIQTAFLALVGKVDAVYVPLDNMIVSAMKSVSALALKNNLPLFVADSGSVEAGALACLGYSYLQAGHKTGEIVSEILNGKSPSEIAIASPGRTDIFINQNALEKLGLSLPEAVRAQAHFY